MTEPTILEDATPPAAVVFFDSPQGNVYECDRCSKRFASVLPARCCSEHCAVTAFDAAVGSSTEPLPALEPKLASVVAAEKAKAAAEARAAKA